MSKCLDLGFHELFRPGDWFYRWVDAQYVVKGEISEAHWPTSQWKEGLSCDWSILSGPDETAKRHGTLPEYVLRFSVKACLDLQIRVHHCPVIDQSSPHYNLAHCQLFPPEPGKRAIRNLRKELAASEKAKLLWVRPHWTYAWRACIRRCHVRYGAATRYIKTSQRR